MHDLTNRRSNTNLRAWVKEVLGTCNYSWEESPEGTITREEKKGTREEERGDAK